MEIKLNKIRKKYRESMVLDIEELTIRKGTITGITGSNGAGKTTLLQIIAGLDDKYEGSVTYDGEALNAGIHERMTLVFQKPYLFRRTVFDNIAYPLQVRKWSKESISKRVMETALLLDIEALLAKKGHQLSGGESQKVATARALAHEPMLLLLDEPTSNLDPDSAMRMEGAVRKYNEDTGATVVIITHNMEQAERLCHDQIRLELGRMK
jgi:tungstate transport system ATP-binding protein